jgi:hypothetical protein
MSSQSSQSKLPDNIAEEAVKALSLLDEKEQKKVLEYIQALVTHTNESEHYSD